jgi:hypothetical protein
VTAPAPAENVGERVARLVREALRRPDWCEEGVTRRSEFQPCEKLAVALRIDEEGDPYPVCAFHARGSMVSLSALVKLAGRSA